MGVLMDPQIDRYYGMGFEEDRLFMNAEGELEFVRTQEIISRYLPPPPAVVLDIGGGPGAYALWLASLGYQVHLVDLVPLHLEQARTSSAKQSQRPIQTITLGDARNLEHPDGFADVILLLGPLYHLTKRDDRLMALREAWRVLKPEGLLFAVGISRFASTLAGLIDGLFQDPDFVNIAHRDVREGQHRNPTDKANYFTTAFFHHPDELRGELMEAGFKLGSLLAVEGIAVFLQDLDAQWQDPIRRERILESARWLESEPSVLGVTGHIIAIAEKTKPR
jgi:ubiquinone/menaquinone biosynthesis C-methylase UbiE